MLLNEHSVQKKIQSKVSHYRKAHVWISDGMSYKKKNKGNCLVCVCVCDCVCSCIGQLQACFFPPAHLTDPYQTGYECTCKCTETKVQLTLRLVITLTSLSHQYGPHPDGVESLPVHKKGKTCHVTKRGTSEEHFFFYGCCRQPHPSQYSNVLPP